MCHAGCTAIMMTRKITAKYKHFTWRQMGDVGRGLIFWIRFHSFECKSTTFHSHKMGVKQKNLKF